MRRVSLSNTGAQDLTHRHVAMAYAAPFPGDSNWGVGNIGVHQADDGSTYNNPGFMRVGAAFTTDHAGLYWCGPTTLGNWTTQSLLHGTFNGMPNISRSVDAFAKSYTSLLLSDFGIWAPATNALASANGIQYLQSYNDSQLAETSAALGRPVSGTVSKVLDAGDALPPLSVDEPVTLNAQYLCSVPKRKGGASLVFPVLIADIVFLQTCWRLFSLVMAWFVGRRDKQSNFCAGCVEAMRMNVAAADDGLRPSTFRSTSERSELQELLPMHSRQVKEPGLCRRE